LSWGSTILLPVVGWQWYFHYLEDRPQLPAVQMRGLRVSTWVNLRASLVIREILWPAQNRGALLGGLDWFWLLFREGGLGEVFDRMYDRGCGSGSSELRLELMRCVHLDQEDGNGSDDQTEARHLSMRLVMGT